MTEPVQRDPEEKTIPAGTSRVDADQNDLVTEARATIGRAGESAFTNVQVGTGSAARRALVVRFPRTRPAVTALAIAVALIVASAWALIVSPPEQDAALPVTVGLVAADAFFGMWVFQLLMLAARGGFFGVIEGGVIIDAGLTSIVIPWTSIATAVPDADASRNRMLRLVLKGHAQVPGWPWTTSFLLVLFGSSRREVHVLEWWLAPVAVDPIVALVRHLLTHPGDRASIGLANPDEWHLDGGMR